MRPTPIGQTLTSRRSKSRRDYLIIVRSGPNSQHPNWVAEDLKRNWDLHVCAFARTDASARIPDSYELGLKWTGVIALLLKWKEWRRYKYVAFVDDDILAPPGTWSKFFKIVDEVGAALAAPALMIGSAASHYITVQAAPTGARPTTFVEIMMPCFRQDVLAELYPTFGLTATGIGWGLDYLWASILNYEGIYVVDETPVRHPQSGSYSAELNLRGHAEMARLMKQFGVVQREENIMGKSGVRTTGGKGQTPVSVGGSFESASSTAPSQPCSASQSDVPSVPTGSEQVEQGGGFQPQG